ncbi:hypothetical protein ISN45_Aa02g010170 [Arabidopsis thaliana x Arabidopsis arenosa]|uniref:Uncharacterized protein n=1 Tax=Arabidopsis thaliana x Arabidopsis arenosa TaxID=1240361 RepID=A0A8T2BJL3_9BRAS|nr:hypothetical protein ISN45_Aa02g010170 [Arabidopsis thaliana x Arabidopsis arenosa]
MEIDSEKEESYKLYRDSNWSHGESKPDLSYHEPTLLKPSWYEDNYSNSDCGEEPNGADVEPEPPDPKSSSQRHTKPCFGADSEREEKDYVPQYLTFSGYNQSTEDYLRWEENMEENFQSCQVPMEEQLSYALDALTGPAYEWWEQEENTRVNYNEPAHTWESFKLEIYEEFVKKAAAQDLSSSSPTRPQVELAGRAVSTRSLIESGCRAKHEKGVILSYFLKEEPPDEPHILTPPQCQGKILHPHILPWTNLTYLCVGDQVLRTKLLEEGGYDAVIDPRTNHGEDYGRETTTQEQPSGILNKVLSTTSGQSRFRLSEKTPEPCSVQTKAKINSSCPEITWNTFSSQLPSTSKKNQPKRSSHERVIQFTSRVIPSLPDLDIHRVIGGFRADQKELSYEVNFHTILTHQKTTESWNQVNTNFGLRDINFLNRRSLHLPYLEPFGFRRLQTYHWRPGDFNILLEAPYNTLRCTKTHRIRRILTHLHFPYPEPILPYLPCLKPKEINQQEIFPHLFECDLETLLVNKRLPRTHHFLPKLSRYKLTVTFLISTDFAISFPTASFSFNFAICYLF